MAGLEFMDDHNELAMLQKPKQAEGFEQITIDGNQVIQSRVCDKPITVSEGCIRTHLRLDDPSGISSLPKDDLFEEIGRMGYEGPTEHCISRKTTGWSEFNSTIAYALVCLATSRKFNFSQMILNDLLSNLDIKTKTKRFYMYPRFVQEVLHNELTDLPSFQEVYVSKPPKGKVFSNMKRPSKDFSGQDTPLFSTMIGVSHSHCKTSGSKPTSDQPTDDLPTPFISINPPQIPIVKPISPITKTYIRKKVQKVPSLSVSLPQKPASPLMEHSQLENIQRETIGVSRNPKKVLSKEKEEHVGSKAHTTDFAQGVDQDSVNIAKTFPTTTLGEQSSKGPMYQETTGVEGASDRQKASTKRSKDPSRVVKTPKRGEDRYNCEELMDTLSTISLEVHNQDLEIKELKKVITSQQVQISKLKKMVLKLVHKKKKTKFVLKKRNIDHDASKKGETQEDESEKKSPVGMESQFKGEIGAETEKEVVETAHAAETEQAAETFVKAAEIGKATVTESAAETIELAVETENVAAETGLSVEEIEIAETLVRAKIDTPKATQKAKGVVIKEGRSDKKRKEVSEAEAKRKGKEKVVEPVKPSKKSSQIKLDEEIAKKMQEDIEKEEEIQTAKDRQIALDLSTKLNEEYQKSLKLAAKKVTMKASRQRQPSKTRERQPSKTFLAAQERRKMINFLKSEEGTPTKEKTEVKKEESLAQKIGAIKRKKSIATKKQAKRARIEEVDKEKEKQNQEPPSQQSEQPRQPEEHFELYMTITDEEPVKVDPISVEAPEIIHWDTLVDKRTEYFRIKRMGDYYEVYATWGKIIRSCTRVDLEEMYKVGLNLYGDLLKGAGMNIKKMAMEYLCMMFDPERVQYVIKDLHLENGFKRIDNWMLFERSGVYAITIDKSYHEYYLVDKVYDHSKAKLQGMLRGKLVCPKGSEMARIVIRRTINQSLGLDPNLGN
ncbi:hypothetical protein L6452_02315 [Arctium lappa]|uniref:Uncharacterized protein n=1 Tax=Arctium lappa TaxID=4217 RepID=A0ACB9FJ90_ARCLA|nr:hypothetical protein L6452_02315 [Arctium lappa]